jgi:nicotinamidase-related amidase
MDAIVVVDMQIGLLSGAPKYDLQGVVNPINRLTANVRARSGAIIFVRHCGRAGDNFAPQTPGWEFLPEVQRHQADVIVEKTLNDPFAGTDLKAMLERIAPDRLLISGWATDFCVDATVRSAVSNGYSVVVIADGHTLSDRPHLDARTIIGHHNWVWSNLITNRSIRLANTSELLLEVGQQS